MVVSIEAWGQICHDTLWLTQTFHFNYSPLVRIHAYSQVIKRYLHSESIQRWTCNKMYQACLQVWKGSSCRRTIMPTSTETAIVTQQKSLCRYSGIFNSLTRLLIFQRTSDSTRKSARSSLSSVRDNNMIFWMKRFSTMSGMSEAKIWWEPVKLIALPLSFWPEALTLQCCYIFLTTQGKVF